MLCLMQASDMWQLYVVQGKWYMLVEIVSQSYRCVIPITPWIYFLLDDEDSTRLSFAMLLLVAYVGFKVCSHFVSAVQLLMSLLLDTYHHLLLHH